MDELILSSLRVCPRSPVAASFQFAVFRFFQLSASWKLAATGLHGQTLSLQGQGACGRARSEEDIGGAGMFRRQAECDRTVESHGPAG
jgi:hypothetical protein